MKNYLEKLFIIEGILLAIIGVLFFVNPLESFIGFTSIIGALIVVASIIRIFRGFKSDRKAYFILTGIIDIFFGLIIWFYPVLTTANLILICGIWAFVKGIYNLIISVKEKEFHFNTHIVLSILAIILGGIIFMCPLLIVFILPYVPYLLGAYFIVIAITEIYVGYELR